MMHDEPKLNNNLSLLIRHLIIPDELVLIVYHGDRLLPYVVHYYLMFVYLIIKQYHTCGCDHYRVLLFERAQRHARNTFKTYKFISLVLKVLFN